MGGAQEPVWTYLQGIYNNAISGRVGGASLVLKVDHLHFHMVYQFGIHLIQMLSSLSNCTQVPEIPLAPPIASSCTSEQNVLRSPLEVHYRGSFLYICSRNKASTFRHWSYMWNCIRLLRTISEVQLVNT